MNTLLTTAIIGAREAGKAIMELYASTDFETKTDGSPVTAADNRSNEILLKALTATRIPILSEESQGIFFPYRDGTPFAETAQGLAIVSQTISPSLLPPCLLSFGFPSRLVERRSGVSSSSAPLTQS